jgi:hypothetical protein
MPMPGEAFDCPRFSLAPGNKDRGVPFIRLVCYLLTICGRESGKILQGDVGWRLKIAPVGLRATKSACADWVGTFVLARAGVALAALASRGALETRLLHSPDLRAGKWKNPLQESRL